MVDIVSKSKRSEMMSRISSRNTKPEILVRKFLFSKGFRYRKNVNKLSGSPDIVMAKYHTVIFVNGCFWHFHEGCKLAHIPMSNVGFWKDKIDRNIARDKENIEQLESMGWKVIIVWECELRNKQTREERLELLVSQIIKT